MNKSLKRYLLTAVIVIAALLILLNQPGANEFDAYREVTRLTYTGHARCRMDCREITEPEIRKVLSKGDLNEAKSGFDTKHKNHTYAVEGYGDDGQHIRVVVTPKNGSLLVITVIDLKKEWACDCN